MGVSNVQMMVKPLLGRVAWQTRCCTFETPHRVDARVRADVSDETQFKRRKAIWKSDLSDEMRDVWNETRPMNWVPKQISTLDAGQDVLRVLTNGIGADGGSRD